MSLLKRLLISLSVALGVILVGTMVLSSSAARRYMSEQLTTQSNNAAASLALSLSQPANQEPVTRELLMSALFDTGQFRSIQMTAPDGSVLFNRQQDVAHNRTEVPQWFQSLMPLPLAQGHRAISSGWRQVGHVQVTVDNRMAQTALWDSAVHMGGLVLLAGGAWALFVTYLLSWFRRVLREEVAAQVMRIGTSHDLAPPDKAAPVAELHAISHAIHKAHVRVQKHEQAQAARIEVLELETNSDMVTGLPNRKYFLNELNKALQGDVPGHVFLLRQRDLQALNQSRPRSEVDDWLRGVTQQVRQSLAHGAVTQAQLARLNGSDFALLLPGKLGPELMDVVHQLRSLLQSQCLRLGEGRWSRWAFVMTPYALQDLPSQVLRRLDKGLMQAESAGHGEVEFIDEARSEEGQAGTSEAQWQQVLASAIQRPEALRLTLHTEKSESSTGVQSRYEASLELRDAEGDWLAAANFLPAATRLGWAAEFDCKAVALALEQLPQLADILVVRISLASLEHEEFVGRVHAMLQSAVQARGTNGVDRLVLELDAHAFDASPQAAFQFADMATQHGAVLGLRRLDASPKVLLHIPHLRLRFVKLGGYFAQQSLHNLGARAMLEAVVHTASAQQAQVLVTDGVPAESMVALRAQGVYLPVGNE